MAAITFVSGATTWTPGRNPLFPGVREHISMQVHGETDGGQLYVYDKGVERQIFELHFRLLETAKDNLLNFIRATISYGLNTFTYNDEDGNAHTVRYVNESLRREEIAPGIFDISLTLREEL